VPQVPVAQNTVGIASMNDAKLRPADFGAAGEMVGRSLEGVGQQLDEVAQQEHENQAFYDNAATKTALNHVNQWQTETGYTGTDPYFMKDGKDAVAARPLFEQGLTQTIKDQRAQLKTKRQQMMFDEAIVPQQDAWTKQIAEHADKAGKTWDRDESVGRQENAGNEAALSVFQDPKHSEALISTGIGEVQQQAKIEGWGPEFTQAKVLAYTSGVRKDIAHTMVYSGPGGPEVAQAYLDQHRGDFTHDDADRVQADIRVYTNTVQAEQRRAEADARREEREQRHETQQRVEQVLLDITDGNKVDPKVRAAAEADARTLDNPGLVDRLHKAGMKADITTQYQNALPTDIQNDLNTVNAQISKGDKTGDLTLKRDQLTTILQKNSGELHSDPVSWAAAHMGIDPGKLDINNPQSIQQRISVAQSVNRRTGAPLRVMTNEEAASYAPIVATGSVDQRTKLVMGLARFGSLATSAAQQIAPGNAQFQNLVGLASHPVPAVAVSRVNQVIAGLEIMKSNPNLFKGDNGQVQQQFDTMTGNALMFLPSVRAGAFENAKAILANDANEHGQHDWGAANGRWGAAVSSALGGYHVGNVQYGGLATFNGVPTVLPSNMNKQDFETRVSRATGQQFVAASGNRTPFLSNGKVPNATMLKSMQWVPAGDGVYRLSDGNGFVRTRDHQFYQIDVRKLH
jgi:hypothetical protein